MENKIDSKFKKVIKTSAKVHVAVLASIIILPSIFNSKHTPKLPPVHTVELVNIPKPEKPKVKKQKPKIKKKPAKPKAKPKPKPKPKKKKSPVKKKRIIKKPKVAPLTTPSLAEKLSKKLDTVKTETVKAKPRTTKQKKSITTPQYKTTISRPSDFPFQWYLNFIQSKISSLWHQPHTVIEKKYSTTISFIILKDGSVANISVQYPSGMKSFDNTALQAVRLAQPLPPLPAAYKQSQLKVNVSFNLE